MSLDFTDDQSTSVQVIGYRRQYKWYILQDIYFSNMLTFRNSFSVHGNPRTCRTFAMARAKCPMRDFINFNKIYKRPVGLSSFVNCPPVVASFLTQRQLSINAGWQHMGRVPHPNYVDPECYVATVCHHVRFMYWEHLGHFQRAISHLKWHKIVCMRYLACAFSQMKSTDMFSMYLQSGVPRHFVWWFIAGWT